MSSASPETQIQSSAGETWKTVCQLDDLVSSSGVCVLFNNQQVAIFKIGNSDSLYALSNYDPFSEANVLSRGILGSLNGNLVVASPIYKEHFRLKDGVCIEDETVSIETFSARVDGDHVQLQLNT